MHRKIYRYIYQQGLKKHTATSCHDDDEEAISYCRSLENNGQIKIDSLKINGFEIWEPNKKLKRILKTNGEI